MERVEHKMIAEDLPMRIRDMERVFGGLRVKLKLPWSYPLFFNTEESKEYRLHEKCMKVVHTCSDFTELGGMRKHGRLIQRGTVFYFPLVTEKLKLPSHLGNHLWEIYRKNLKPDKKFIKNLEDTLMFSLTKFSETNVYIEAMVLNDTLMNFNWLNQHLRQAVIQAMGIFLWHQPHLFTVILENAMLQPQDSVRFLYVFAYCAGKYIENLNLCYFFKYGFHPITDPQNSYSIHDPFIFSEEHTLIAEEYEQEQYWDYLVIRGLDHVLSSRQLSHVYKMCLNLFTTLTALHIQYSYLTEGQGRTLCQIGSILNGSLRYLYLLCNVEDLPKTTNQVISTDAWKQAVTTCPDFEVNLIFNYVAYYDYIKTIVNPAMPLVGFSMDSGIPRMHLDKVNSWDFGSTIKMLTTYFQQRLRFLKLHLWHSNHKVDVTICKCITELYSLEKFEYRGPFDTIDTVAELCSFITNNCLRLRLFYMYVLEDACYAELYREAVSEIYEKYKGGFIAKDMKFILSTTAI